jgi:hypothetical protein
VHRLAKSGALTFAANQGLDEQAAKKTAERSAALLACCCALLPGNSNNNNSSGAGGGGETAAELAAGMGKDAGRLFLDRVAALETSTDASDFEQVRTHRGGNRGEEKDDGEKGEVLLRETP